MTRNRCSALLVVVSLLLPGRGGLAPATAASITPPGETVATAAVVDENLLYVASYETVGRAGHLRAFILSGSRRIRLWDAAERVPLPGATLPPPVDPGLAALAPRFRDSSGERLLFTNLDAAHGFRLLSLAAPAAHVLQPLLGVNGVAEAAALINAVRGRLETSASMPAGSADRPDRLGAISRSSPALVGPSPVAATAANRDQVLYVGAEDGLLHAILAGRREPDTAGYVHTAAECGRELWGYLPGSMLPYLSAQPFDHPAEPAAVHVDGAPVVSDLFIDADRDGFREWRTILVGTASIRSRNRGVVFALDVTDPGEPRLLWETMLADLAPGPSRGAALGWTGSWTDPAPRVFLTFGTAGRIDAAGNPEPLAGSYGVRACALDLLDGRLLWNFATPYPGSAADRAEPPSSPSLLTGAGGEVAGVVFGDLAGRLWLLDPDSGLARGGGPLWQTPGGADEPIGAGLAVRNRLVVFGTGGVAYAADDRSYAVYAVEVLADGSRLLWAQPLAPGERLWGPPALDRFGRLYLGVGSSGAAGTGRLLVLAADGTLAGSVGLAGAPHGGLAVLPGAVVAVSRSGQVECFGELRPPTAAETTGPGRVRVLSWRLL